MSLPASARLAMGAAVVMIAAACASAAPTAPAAASVSQTNPPPTTPTASTTAIGPGSYDTSILGTRFDLPMTFDLPDHWKPLPAPDFGPAGALALAHTGNPESDESQWWGFGFTLVDGARVIDPAEMPKQATSGNAVHWLPWPASYTDYLMALPGVKVIHGPSPIKVGGMTGTTVTLKTPSMHPTLYLKDDVTWLGGGTSGMDPALERQVIEVEVHGHRLLIDYADDPATVADHVAQVNAIIASVAFKS